MTSFEITRWPVGDTALETEWDILVKRLGLNPSLSSGWVNLTTRFIGQDQSALAILIARDTASKELQGVLPFHFDSVRMLGLKLKRLRPASNLMSYHAEIVCESHLEMLEHLLDANPDWDVLHFANLDVAGETARAVQKLARDRNLWYQKLPGDESPFLPLAGSWAELVASKNKKFRYKLKKRTEQLVGDSVLQLRWFSSSEEVPLLLEEILKIEAGSWKAGEGIDIPSRSHEQRYYEALLPFLAERQNLRANVLYSGEQAIAYSLCCFDNGWMGQLKTSFDESFSSLSPGSIVIDACIEDAFALGSQEFDFLGSSAAHKLAWTRSTRQHADFLIFSNRPKGTLVSFVKRMRASLV